MQMQFIQRYPNEGSYCLYCWFLAAGSCQQYSAGKSLLKQFISSFQPLLFESYASNHHLYEQIMKIIIVCRDRLVPFWPIYQVDFFFPPISFHLGFYNLVRLGNSSFIYVFYVQTTC